MTQMADHLNYTPVSPSTSQLVEPQFRLACEECHVRKIRCEPSLSGNGSSCEACHINQRRCLFSLRSKIGRPRKHASQSSRQKQSFTHHGPHATGANGYRQRVLSRTNETQPNPNVPRLPTESRLINQTDSFRHAADHQARWKSEGWQSNARLPPTGTPPNGYFEDLPQTGKDSFGQLLTPSSLGGAQTELFMSDPNDQLQADALMMESWSVPDNNIGENPEVDCDQGFLEALKLYGDLRNCCKNRALNILAETDHYELNSIFRVFDELIQQASTLKANNSSWMLTGSDQPKWRIIRVAMTEAIELCIEVIQYNFRLHNTPSPLEGATKCPVDESLDSSGPGNNAVRCRCLVPLDELRSETQLKRFELLIRLEYSLVQFRHSISKMDCLHGGPLYTSSSTNSGSASQGACQCWITAIPEIDAVRSQVSALVQKLRGMWD